MSSDPFSGPPPDDTGSETLKRYKYQAQIAARFCILCASDNGVKSVYVEYYEDIVVEGENNCKFIQIKSKDSPGNWTLKRASGGLESLFRAFDNVDGDNNEYVLMVEGRVSSNDKILKKIKNNEELTDDEIEKISKEIGEDVGECEEFIERLSFRPNLPQKKHIDTHLLGYMTDKTNGVSKKEIKNACEKLVNLIFKKMSRVSSDCTPYEDVEIETINTKKERQIKKDEIEGEIGTVLEGPYPLLARDLDTDRNPTDLERKLIAAGATDDIIRLAKDRRADAAHRKAEAKNIFGDEQVTDVEERIRGYAAAEVAKHSNQQKPALTSFNGVLDKVSVRCDQIDPSGVFRQDPQLLLGMACELSDECVINWGQSIE